MAPSAPPRPPAAAEPAPPWQPTRDLLDKAVADSATAAWVGDLPATAAALAESLGLRPDGLAWSGHLSVVFPVLDAAGRALVLKVTRPGAGTAREVAALAAWQGRGTVRLLGSGTADRAGYLLLERLDGDRTLEQYEDIDAAVRAIALALTRLHAAPVTAGARAALPTLATEAQRVLDGIEQRVAQKPGVLPARYVDRARETLRHVRHLVSTGPSVIVHGDLHFLNMLAPLGAGPDARPQEYLVIDPLPAIGIPEWELVPMLRNRWQLAQRAGRLDRELRRRVDLAVEVTGMDPELARRVAQAVAVDNIAWMRLRGSDPLFEGAYEAMLGW